MDPGKSCVGAMTYHFADVEEPMLAVSLEDYEGERGGVIRIKICRPLSVQQVGIIILDALGNLMEFGYARRAKQRHRWIYIAKRSVCTPMVTVIVDGFCENLPSAEIRICKHLISVATSVEP